MKLLEYREGQNFFLDFFTYLIYHLAVYLKKEKVKEDDVYLDGAFEIAEEDEYQVGTLEGVSVHLLNDGKHIQAYVSYRGLSREYAKQIFSVSGLKNRGAYDYTLKQLGMREAYLFVKAFVQDEPEKADALYQSLLLKYVD